MYPSYSSSGINQYNPQQSYNPQQPPGQYSPQPLPNQQQAPSIPPRGTSTGVSSPLDQTTTVIAKLKVNYNGISPSTTPATDNKVRLATGPEKVPFERKADLYAILVGLEHLESAFLRDAVTASQYTASCNRFLSQYKTWMDVHSNLITSPEHFVRDTGFSCPAALNRIKAGLPATSVHGGHDASADTGGLMTVDLAEKFITTYDITRVALGSAEPKLEVENIFSYLSDLLDSLVKYPNLPPDHEIKMKVQHWVQFCSSKPSCYYEFTLNELRQMAFDLENAYSNFRKFVAQRKT